MNGWTRNNDFQRRLSFDARKAYVREMRSREAPECNCSCKELQMAIIVVPAAAVIGWLVAVILRK